MSNFIQRSELGTSTTNNPDWYPIVGLCLACGSGFFVGLSLILQKKGQMETIAKKIATGKEASYLENKWWWAGILSSTWKLI